MRDRSLAAFALGLAATSMWVALESADIPTGRPCEAARAPVEARIDASEDAHVVSVATAPADEPASVVTEAAESATESERVAVPDSQDLNAPKGKVIVRAADECGCGRMGSLDVRIGTATRFAQGALAGPTRELEIELTPGLYSLGVSTGGHEPELVHGIEVKSGDTLRLPAVALHAGRARIAGSVRGRSRLAGISVELIGTGRHPCASCVEAARNGGPAIGADPCLACGFASDRSKRALSDRGRFEFEHLAAGPYALRLVDENGYAIGAERAIDLTADRALSVVLDPPSFRSVEIEIVDVDGTPLAAEWERRLAADTASEDEILDLERSIYLAPVELGFSAGARVLARAEFQPPPPAGKALMFRGGCGSRCRGSRRGGPICDRARAPGDALVPEPPAAHFPTQRLECALDGRGIAAVQPLPTSKLRLHVSAEMFRADVVVPASRDTTHVRVQLEAPSCTKTIAPASYLALESERIAKRGER